MDLAYWGVALGRSEPAACTSGLFLIVFAVLWSYFTFGQKETIGGVNFLPQVLAFLQPTDETNHGCERLAAELFVG